MKDNYFSHTLLDWFEQNKRDLPWRNTTDAYKIWLSEVILQQTRVAQGLPYYEKFIQKYPTVYDLANATEQEVLKNWQGLGYYSRARNMRHTAKTVVESGEPFPDSYEKLIRLKGIGDYTASAVATFSSNEKVAVLDGNVFRLLSRYFGIEEPIDVAKSKKIFKKIAVDLLPKHSVSAYNQAIMEFGALQCTPKKPNCSNCPLALDCFAHKNNKVDSLPVKSKKQLKKKLYLNYIIFRANDLVLVRKREKIGVWEGLYDFTAIEKTEPLPDDEVLFSAKEIAGQELQILQKPKREYKHILSHIVFHAQFWEIHVPFKFEPKEKNCKWVKSSTLGALPVSRLVEKYLEG